MLEKDFRNSIDAKFPYNDLLKGRELIDLSISISDESVFFVIGELVRIPRGLENKVNKSIVYELLNYVDTNFQHNLKRYIIDVARGILNGQKINNKEAIILMDKIAEYNGLYSALNLVYFAIDDEDGEIENKYNFITKTWNNK